jgi:hypothetical protein
MAYYVAPFTFSFVTNLIVVDAGYVNVDCAALYAAIKQAQASEEGIIYDRIAEGSGLVELGPGVQVGLTVELLGNWQLSFPVGNYVATVAGGNFVGGPGGDPIAYSAGSVPTPAQNAAAVLAAMNSAPPAVNVAQVNGYTVDGQGTEENPWGPS